MLSSHEMLLTAVCQSSVLFPGAFRSRHQHLDLVGLGKDSVEAGQPKPTTGQGVTATQAGSPVPGAAFENGDAVAPTGITAGNTNAGNRRSLAESSSTDDSRSPRHPMGQVGEDRKFKRSSKRRRGHQADKNENSRRVTKKKQRRGEDSGEADTSSRRKLSRTSKEDAAINAYVSSVAAKLAKLGPDKQSAWGALLFSRPEESDGDAMSKWLMNIMSVSDTMAGQRSRKKFSDSSSYRSDGSVASESS